MRLFHPTLDPSTIVESDDPDYLRVLQRRGWEIAPALPELPDVSGATVQAVLEAVGDDAELAAAALEEERAGKNRSTLISALEAIVAAGGAAPDPDDGTSADHNTDTEEHLS